MTNSDFLTIEAIRGIRPFESFVFKNSAAALTNSELRIANSESANF